MLDKPSYHLADQIVTLLAKQNLYITPIEGTPVSALSDETPYLTNLELNQQKLPSELDKIAEGVIRATMSSKSAGINDHDDVKAHWVDVIKRSLRQNRLLARTVALPIVDEIVERVSAYVDTANEAELDRISLVQYRVADLWSNHMLSSITKNWEGGKGADHPHKLPQIKKVIVDHDSVIELINNDIFRMDDDVELFIRNINLQTLVDIVTDCFSGEWWLTNSKIFSSPLSRKASDCQYNIQTIDLSLVLFLIVRGQFREDTAGEFSKSHAALASIIQTNIKSQTSLKSSDTLVSTWPTVSDFYQPSGLTIIANGTAFDRFIKEGGSVDILFGAALTNDRGMSYKPILDRKEMYEEIFERKIREIKDRDRARTDLNTRLGFSSILTNFINDPDNADVVKSRSAAHTRLQKAIARHKYIKSEEVYLIAIDIVCETLFHDTMVHVILRRINEYSREFPDREIPPREAALVASIRIAAEYLAGMYWVCRT